jgi:hypothetical protein
MRGKLMPHGDNVQRRAAAVLKEETCGVLMRTIRTLRLMILSAIQTQNRTQAKLVIRKLVPLQLHITGNTVRGALVPVVVFKERQYGARMPMVLKSMATNVIVCQHQLPRDHVRLLPHARVAQPANFHAQMVRVVQRVVIMDASHCRLVDV